MIITSYVQKQLRFINRYYFDYLNVYPVSNEKCLGISGASGKARALLPNKFLIEKPAYKLLLIL